MRTITTHKVNGLNDGLTITVLDEPGAGGACHCYEITWEYADPNPYDKYCDIGFQDGPIQEVGVNGVSNEALLAIVRDRLEAFQAGPYACEENATALEGVLEAMVALHRRTRNRLQRGVEGTSAA